MGLATAGRGFRWGAGWRWLALYGCLVGSAPALEIVVDEPAAGATGEVRLGGRTVPGARVTLTVGGANAEVVTAGADGRFAFTPLTLAEGDNHLLFTATDGRSASTASLHLTRDATPPEVTIIPPLGGAGPWLTARSPTLVEGRTEPGLTVTLELRDRRVETQADPAGHFALPLPAELAEGDNALLLTVVDRAGNATRRALRIILDTTPPPLVLRPPLTADWATAEPALTVAGRTEPGATVTLHRGDRRLAELVAEADGAFVFAGAPLAEGENNLRIEVADALGNRQTVARRVCLDTTPPEVTLFPPWPAETVRLGATSAVLGGRTEPEARVEVWLGDRLLTAGRADVNGLFESGPLTLDDGLQTLHLRVLDALGNERVLSRRVEVDRRPPPLQIITPGPVAYVETPRLEIAGRTEPGVELTLRELVEGSRATRADALGNFLFADIPVADGYNAWLLTATDDLGNTTVATVEAQGRVSQPWLRFETPAEGWQDARPTAVELTCEAGVELTVTLDGQPLPAGFLGVPYGGPIPRRQVRLPLSDLPPGPHTLQAVAVSPSGRRRAAAVRRFHLPGGPRSLAIDLTPEAPGSWNLQLTVADAWGQPVADGTPLMVSLPPGWVTADGRRGQITLASRAGRAEVTLRAGETTGAGLLEIAAGLLVETRRLAGRR